LKCAQNEQLGPRDRALGDYFFRWLTASDANARLDLRGLYFPQQLFDFGHGAGRKPLVPQVLLDDVEHSELSRRFGSEIHCEPERMFRVMTQ
jgi:hypothetical protein